MRKPIDGHDRDVDGRVSANDNPAPRKNMAPPPFSELFQSGDPATYNQFVKDTNQPLKEFLFRLLGSREDAEEVAQDAFVRIWQKRNDLSADQPPKAFLYHIAKGLAVDRLRERKRAETLSEDLSHRPVDYADSPEYIAEQNEIQARIDRAVDSMPAVMKQIYLMKFRRGLDNNQIARELSITPSSVRVQVARAEKRIRKAVAAPVKNI